MTPDEFEKIYEASPVFGYDAGDTIGDEDADVLDAAYHILPKLIALAMAVESDRVLNRYYFSDELTQAHKEVFNGSE